MSCSGGKIYHLLEDGPINGYLGYPSGDRLENGNASAMARWPKTGGKSGSMTDTRSLGNSVQIDGTDRKHGLSALRDDRDWVQRTLHVERLNAPALDRKEREDSDD